LRESLFKLVGEDLADEALSLYRQRFGDVGLYENTLYPGVHETLEELAASDLNLYIASSKPHVYVRRILDHFELSRYFAEVFGAELDGTRSDKSDLLGHALEVSGADAATSIMLGDRKHDMMGALANELIPIGATYGYGSVAELEAAGAQDLIDSFEQVSGIALVMR
jgi:phosphoglycolate phosphatase